MDGAFPNALVDKPYDGFSSLLDHEGGARRDAIVSDELCWLLSSVDLLRERLDLDLIVVDWYSGCCIGV